MSKYSRRYLMMLENTIPRSSCFRGTSLLRVLPHHETISCFTRLRSSCKLRTPLSAHSRHGYLQFCNFCQLLWGSVYISCCKKPSYGRRFERLQMKDSGFNLASCWPHGLFEGYSTARFMFAWCSDRQSHASAAFSDRSRETTLHPKP